VLDDWLKNHAVANDRSGMTNVYVTTRDGRVAGYYGLCTSVIEHEDAIKKVGRGMPRHPIPALLITRFAVSLDEQGAGLGRHLLRDALVRAVKVADDVGVRALHVHAKDDAARAFSTRFGFAQSPVDDAHLQLPLKTIRASLGAAGTGDSA
jgi:GNAT superfamily N-acetyltransferase